MNAKWQRTGAALTLVVTLSSLVTGIARPPSMTTVAAVGRSPALTSPDLGAEDPEVDPAADPAVVAALERAARPLRTVEPGGDTRDLRALDQAVGDARVVGIGEATHGSHDFFALRDRAFRHLVERRGFRTFALEASWSTGMRLNDYVLHGKGDPRRIMGEEFQRDYLWWNNTDYQRLIDWMRSYNLRHPDDPVRFMGDDIAWSGPELYDAVTGHVTGAHPELADRLAGLYRGLRPAVPTGAYIEQYLAKPHAERLEMAERTGEALRLLREGLAGRQDSASRSAVQNATVIDQTARQYAFDFDDPEQIPASMRYRDEAMAANVDWWQRHTGDRILLAAHDDHVAYTSTDPDHYPKVQGAFLRDRLGSGYVSVGVTFGQGSFNATHNSTDVTGPQEDRIYRWTLGPAAPGSNEYTLDRVGHRDYLVDLREVGGPARDWLARARPIRLVGTAYPDGPAESALLPAHDVLIHLHRVTAARLPEQEVTPAPL
ncbi:erythromycin esterase family protein [Streptomyces sp. NPDC088789]|uniref:erythromycin esterase family protein n=1 Tax=Streptomyces sp. NPDC088789 TaxID=3365899 RepID=UPI00382AD761